jgi:hypothetical protein
MVNAKGLKDKVWADKMIADAKALLADNHQKADALLAKVEAAIA